MDAPKTERLAGGDERQTRDPERSSSFCLGGRSEDQGGGQWQWQPGTLPKQPSADAYERGHRLQIV
jgi:hypothetical protein